MTILIAGAGIAGLTLGLTLHQIGVPFRIYEAVPRLGPLGVGINLQPTAVRELHELGLAAPLSEIGVATRDYGFYTRTGLEIWTEPRGLGAGYQWPQYSVHRGALQMLLRDTLVDRCGPECLVQGARATGFRSGPDAVQLHLAHHAGGVETVAGALLVAADGIHSAIRAQLYPQEGPPVWGGAVLWRGTTRARPFLSGASMILAGNDSQRVVAYPISAPGADGLATINWIAERCFDTAGGWAREDWNRKAAAADILPHFTDWRFDWLDVPALIRDSAAIYEYPMVDRDPIPRWTEGRATLIGDAAHPTYPVGSNGASQAIVDARVLGAALLADGVRAEALQAYEAQVRPGVNAVVLANRGSGPDAIMQMVEDRCGGDFSRMDAVITQDEKAAHAARYKALAGLSIADLNARAPLIPDGARVAMPR